MTSLFNVWFIVKIFYLLALAIYLVFALVVVKQVRIMNQTLDVGFETILAIFSYLHLLFALAVFLTAIIVL